MTDTNNTDFIVEQDHPVKNNLANWLYFFLGTRQRRRVRKLVRSRPSVRQLVMVSSLPFRGEQFQGRRNREERQPAPRPRMIRTVIRYRKGHFRTPESRFEPPLRSESGYEESSLRGATRLTLLRGLRRDNDHPAQKPSAETHRLAAPGARGGRPVRA